MAGMTNVNTWNDIAYKYTNHPWHSWPAHVDRPRPNERARLMWGSDFVAHISPDREGRVLVLVWNGNQYTGPAERVIPLALDDYLEDRMQYRD